ncbi:MAG: bifunctional nuclease family protein [Pelolinea sp.]|nr:bifunctional nuclease family protein [Pelolinea sp.]
MKKLMEVKIDSLRVSLTNQQRIVVLKQVDQDRYLPVWIGPYEAEAITIAMQEIEVSRPQTHDLVKNILINLDAKMIHVEISALKDDIFYGTLLLTKDDKEIHIDCRPSDAIAIAVRAHVPILVSEEVMGEASIIPEEISAVSDEGGNSTIEETDEGGKLPPNEERLSIFEDYLKKKNDQAGPSEGNEDSQDDDEGDDKSASPG